MWGDCSSSSSSNNAAIKLQNQIHQRWLRLSTKHQRCKPPPTPHPVSCWSPACSCLGTSFCLVSATAWSRITGWRRRARLLLVFHCPASLSPISGWNGNDVRSGFKSKQGEHISDPGSDSSSSPWGDLAALNGQKRALGSGKSAAVSLNPTPRLGMPTGAYFSHQEDMFYQGNNCFKRKMWHIRRKYQSPPSPSSPLPW